MSIFQSAENIHNLMYTGILLEGMKIYYDMKFDGGVDSNLLLAFRYIIRESAIHIH